MGHARSRSNSSSGEEDGDDEWRAAINSIASADPFLTKNCAVNTSKRSSRNDDKLSEPNVEEDTDPIFRPQLPKHYQIKWSSLSSLGHTGMESPLAGPMNYLQPREVVAFACEEVYTSAQKLLDDIVERNLEIVSNPVNIEASAREDDGGGIQLFRNAPHGIIFDRTDEPQGPKKKPRIRPGEEIDEKSKKFKGQLQSVVVNGLDVMDAAKAASQKSLARLEARDVVGKAATKREEERVAELKRIRGERWLPSIAKEMQLECQGQYNEI